MLTLLLSLCLGLANAARGSGIHHLKFPELLTIGLCAWVIHPIWWYSGLAILPMATMFAIGTGEIMAILVKTPIKIWRYWEFLLPFFYYLLYFNLPI